MSGWKGELCTSFKIEPHALSNSEYVYIVPPPPFSLNTCNPVSHLLEFSYPQRHPLPAPDLVIV